MVCPVELEFHRLNGWVGQRLGWERHRHRLDHLKFGALGFEPVKLIKHDVCREPRCRNAQTGEACGVCNTAVVGLREVPENLRDLMRSMRAAPAQTLRLLELPAALPVLLGGLRVGATLSVIGAVVGELVGADRGLGFLINVGRGQYDTALVFVGVFTLIFLALTLYGLVLLLEKNLLRWKNGKRGVS